MPEEGGNAEKADNRGHLDLGRTSFKMDRGNGAPWWLRVSGKMQSKLRLKLPTSVIQTVFNG